MINTFGMCSAHCRELDHTAIEAYSRLRYYLCALRARWNDKRQTRFKILVSAVLD